jgi:hypothetical protein
MSGRLNSVALLRPPARNGRASAGLTPESWFMTGAADAGSGARMRRIGADVRAIGYGCRVPPVLNRSGLHPGKARTDASDRPTAFPKPESVGLI